VNARLNRKTSAYWKGYGIVSRWANQSAFATKSSDGKAIGPTATTWGVLLGNAVPDR
jgi:hypothetical protein